jgi:cyclopropane fatty-acyl-phospholipid synthase-like methyltransferase
MDSKICEDKFAFKANDYDKEVRRLKSSEAIANKIRENIAINKSMHLLDFGSGTGLLLEELASEVSKITAVDISPSMTKVLREKSIPCELDIKELDLTKEPLNIKVDGIISSMTMHHIKDIEAMFKKFYSMLKRGGFIAIADLDTEDGSFHSVDTGVEYFGFDRDEFLEYAKKAGFKNCKIEDATIISKSYGDFGVFLLTATKN